MDNETFLDATEAIWLGLADEIESNSIDFSKKRLVPIEPVSACFWQNKFIHF